MAKQSAISQQLAERISIPVGLVDAHQEVFRFWKRFQDADLLHIDAHDDMSSGARLVEPLPENYHSLLNAGNFICPAFYYGLISSVYWLNPHSEKRRLQDFGSREGIAGQIEGRNKLETEIKEWDNGVKGIYWIPFNLRYKIIQGKGKIISPEEVRLRQDKPFILDIDLDAFSCQQEVHNTSEFYKGINDYKQRIELAREVLRGLRRPSIITISTSQSADGREYCFVPPELVDDVQEKTFEMLRGVYET